MRASLFASLALALGISTPALAANEDLNRLMALHTLGVNHELGRGVERDYAAAAHWYEQAARQGYADSQHDLAKLYEDGRGVARDHARAYAWYSLAARRGNPVAVMDRDAMQARMSAGELDAGQRLLDEWLRAGGVPTGN